MLSTGDMARASGNTLRTVRFYEEAGLLEPTTRSDGGHRLFPAAELDRLHLITELRAANWSIDDIRELLELREQYATGAEASDALKARLDEQVVAIHDRIAILQRLVDELNATKNLLAGCGTCDDKKRFRRGCSQCEVIQDADDVPRAARLVWRVD